MVKINEDASKFGKEAVDNGLKSFAAVSQSAQAIAMETSEYMKRSLESGVAAWQEAAKAKSLESALEIQSSYAKSAYEGFVAEASKLQQLYTDMAKEAFKPFEAAFARAK